MRMRAGLRVVVAEVGVVWTMPDCSRLPGEVVRAVVVAKEMRHVLDREIVPAQNSTLFAQIWPGYASGFCKG